MEYQHTSEPMGIDELISRGLVYDNKLELTLQFRDAEGAWHDYVPDEDKKDDPAFPPWVGDMVPPTGVNSREQGYLWFMPDTPTTTGLYSSRVHPVEIGDFKVAVTDDRAVTLRYTARLCRVMPNS
jgi:hypothetical protein